MTRRRRLRSAPGSRGSASARSTSATFAGNTTAGFMPMFCAWMRPHARVSGTCANVPPESAMRNQSSWSWTQAGYLNGKVNKKRTRSVVTPVVVTFALLLGYLCGLRGKMLLDTAWTRMLDRTPAEITDLAAEASKQGWMNYKAAGSVVEVTFPGLLTPQEEKTNESN